MKPQSAFPINLLAISCMIVSSNTPNGETSASVDASF